MKNGVAGMSIGSALADYSFIVMIFLIILMMILPMPLWLTDALIFFSIVASIVMLMMTMYVRDATSFSSYPVLLLTQAIFRIALSVATTRNILVHGETGDIVHAFGEYAISGNIIVGVVIFVLITVVQFIVINKGSERVAEVGARFTLDSIPGKQMSIEADLRAGNIDANEARRQRSRMQAETQFHGAMDGSMKFLTGDAIAGIIMVVVNFVGGMAIGVVQMGMPAKEALHHYTLLTIGDALVAQIPAILTAISSGLLVTRVAAEEESEHSGESVAENTIRQFREQPKALLAGAVITIGMSFLPGFPLFVCLFFGLALLAAWWGVTRASGATSMRPSSVRQAEGEPGLEVMFAADLRGKLDLRRIALNLNGMVDDLSAELGVPLPSARCTLSDDLVKGQYIVFLEGRPVSGGYYDPELHVAVNCVGVLGICGIEGANPVAMAEDSTRYYELSQTDADTVARLEVRVLTAEAFVIHRVRLILMRASSTYIHLDFVRGMLQAVGKRQPELVKEVTKAVAPHRMAEVLRALAAEQIPLREPELILGKLLEIALREKDMAPIVRELRKQMSHLITLQVLSRDGSVYVIQLGPNTQYTLSKALKNSSQGEFFAITLEQARALETQVKELVAEWQIDAGNVALLAPTPLRAALRRLLHNGCPFLPVVTVEELRPDVQIQSFGYVDLPIEQPEDVEEAA